MFDVRNLEGIEPIKILHVDPSIEVLRASKIKLEALSNNKIQIISCLTAKEVFETDLQKIDILISDNNIGSNSGLDLLSKVRIELKNEIPFILFTADCKENDLIKAINLRVDYYIKKQSSIENQYKDLYNSINQIIEKIYHKKELEKSNQKFHDLFEEMPVVLWEQDWSNLKLKFKEFYQLGIKSGDELKRYFINNREKLFHYAQLIEILDVNTAALTFYGLKHKTDLLGPYGRYMTKDSEIIFINELASYFDGKREFHLEIKTETMSGREVYVYLKSYVAKGYEETLGRVINVVMDFTKEKEEEKILLQKEMELQISEKQRMAILNAIPDSMYEINRNGIYIAYHGDKKNLFSPPEIFLRKSVTEILPDKVAKKFQAMITTTLNTEINQNFDYEVEFSTGQKYFNAHMVKLKPESVLVIVRDITDQKNYEKFLHEKELNHEKLIQVELTKELRTEENKLKVVVQNAPNLIITTDEKGKITFSNRSIGLEGRINVELDKLIGMNIRDLISEEYRIELESNIQKVFLSHEAIACDVKGVFTKRWLHINIGVVREDNSIKNLIFIITDISREKEFEQKLIDRSNEIKAINTELRDFAYIVSHDLKSPLYTINNMIDSLISNIETNNIPFFIKTLQDIRKKTNVMSSLINGILQYSNITESETEYEIIDINETINEVISTINPDKHFKFEISDKIPKINFNKVKIYQLFQNLISNAIKYNDKTEGFVSITYSVSADENQFIVFQVKDNGRGIKKEHFDKIFQLFETVRIDKTLEGSGIGLTIVKKIINQLGGEIGVDSEEGVGTTFTFSISKNFFILS